MTTPYTVLLQERVTFLEEANERLILRLVEVDEIEMNLVQHIGKQAELLGQLEKVLGAIASGKITNAVEAAQFALDRIDEQ